MCSSVQMWVRAKMKVTRRQYAKSHRINTSILTVKLLFDFIWSWKEQKKRFINLFFCGSKYSLVGINQPNVKLSNHFLHSFWQACPRSEDLAHSGLEQEVVVFWRDHASAHLHTPTITPHMQVDALTIMMSSPPCLLSSSISCGTRVLCPAA